MSPTPIIELIQVRKFGDRLNELTGLIYDHYSNFLVHTRWYLLAITAIISVTLLYGPINTTAGSYICQYLLYLLIDAFAIAFVLLVREVAVNSRPIEGIRTFLPLLIRYERTGILTTLLPLLAGCFLPSFFLDSETDFVFSEADRLLMPILLITQLVIVPIMMIICVVVFEDKSGFSAILRAFTLLFQNWLSTFFFYVVLSILGLLIPVITGIPYYFFNQFSLITGNDFDDADPESLLQIFIRIGLYGVTVFGYLHHILIVTLGTVLTYGNAVEKRDNTQFLSQLNNFDHL